MNGVFEGREQALDDLCRRYQVRRLSLFGSATRADFDPSRSDLDFLVEFEEPPDGRYATQYFGLRRELEALFGRAVDLVEHRAIRNPWFRRGIDSSARVLFAA